MEKKEKEISARGEPTSPRRTGGGVAAMASRIQDVLTPLVDWLDPRTLARLGRTCRTLASTVTDSNADALWRTVAARSGCPGCSTRAELVARYLGFGIWSCDAAFGADITGTTHHPATSHGRHCAVLKLGSGWPATRRVAAASTVVSLGDYDSVFVSVLEVPPDGVILWLGVMYHKQGGRCLDASTRDGALSAYDCPELAPEATGRAASGSVAERFSSAEWSLSALGSNGTVWSDGAVKIIGPECRFKAGDVLRITVDVISARRELGVFINGGGHKVLARRLTPRAAAGHRLHVVAQLTDVAAPQLGRTATAVVELGRFDATSW